MAVLFIFINFSTSLGHCFDIVSRIADASMDYVMRTQMYREFNLEYILHNVTLLYVRGICTEAGVRLLDSALGSRDKLCGEKL